MRIHRAEILEAIAVNHIAKVFSLGLILFQPNHQTAIKVDSRKKAKVASIAKSEPKISPTY